MKDHSIAANDVFGAVLRMRAHGPTFLDIPANDCDDLEAKHQFDPAKPTPLFLAPVSRARNGPALAS